MQIRAEKCNPSLNLGGGPIEFRTENLHKHQRGGKKQKLPSSDDRKASQTISGSLCQRALAQCDCVNGGISEEGESMAAPLRSRGAELDFWKGLHSVLPVLGMSGLDPA